MTRMIGSSTAVKIDYGPHEAAMRAYLREGEERAMALGNRGPIRFDADGSLHPGILDAFSRCGFYVFEGVLGADELADVEADLHDVLERLPVEKGSPVDARGRPALGADCKAPALTSPDWRVTVNFGFHRRASVLGVAGGGLHNAPAVYDEERIRKRSRLIGYAIDARRQRFPDEAPFVYQPFLASGERYRWNEEAKADLQDYNLLDLSI